MRASRIFLAGLLCLLVVVVLPPSAVAQFVEALLAHAGNEVELIPFDGDHKAPDHVVVETVLDLLGE